MVLPVKTRNTNTGELEKGNDDVFMSVPIPRSVTELASSATEVEALERKLQRGDLDSTTVHALKELLKADEDEEDKEMKKKTKKRQDEAFTLKNASKADRKEHKRLVKLQKAKKRAEKLKKKVKKRATKGSKKKGSKSSKK